MKLVKVQVQLPQYLAEWLEEFSKEVAMTPSQLLTHILHPYWEVWRIARDRFTTQKPGEKPSS